MFTFMLVAILGVLLVVVVLQLKKKPAATPAMPQKDLSNLKVTDAQAGDTLSISGAGDNLSDLDFTADKQLRIQAGARQWTELSGAYRERRATLRVSGDDDETTCALQSDARKITLDELGLSEDDLAQLDERQNPSDNFEYDGKMWMYRISREVQAYRSGQSVPTAYYYWEFQEQDGKRLLTVRKAEGEPFTATMYNGVHPGDVTVYRGN